LGGRDLVTPRKKATVPGLKTSKRGRGGGGSKPWKPDDARFEEKGRQMKGEACDKRKGGGNKYSLKANVVKFPNRYNSVTPTKKGKFLRSPA